MLSENSPTPTGQNGERELPSWIDGFIQLTEQIQSPRVFREWAAISAIAGAMERKVWIRSQGEDLYSNLYVFLVGPPGSGKTRAISWSEFLWRTLDTHKVAPVSVTKASLMDEVAAASRVIRHPVEMDFNSLLIASKEFGALLPSYDSDFLNALVVLYDCVRYDEKRRGKTDPLIIERPQVNLIGCCTPSYLISTMPAPAWEQGFLSRVIIIYNSAVETKSLDLMEEQQNTTDALAKALTRDMKRIGSRVGRLGFEREAADAIEAWIAGGQKPAPSHERLIHYCTRRTVHLLKLCMVACVDRDGTAISLADYQRALGWLLAAESNMSDVFLAMSSGGDAMIINEAWHYVMTFQARNGRGVPMHLFYQFLAGRAPASSVEKIYRIMNDTKMIKTVQDGSGNAIILAGNRH